MTDADERALIARAVAGGADGKAAFRAIYDRYQRQVFTLCLRLTGTHDRAKDATQEAFLAVHKGLGSFGFQASFRTWLFRVTKNAALQYLRRSSTRAFVSLDVSLDDGSREDRAAGSDDPGRESLGGLGSAGVRDAGRDAGTEAGSSRAVPVGPERGDPLARLMEGEFEDDLQRALDRLSRQHAEVLSLRYFGECSYEELAAVLECSIGTVKSRLNRAHQALRPLLVEVLRRHDREAAGGSAESGPA